MIQQAARCQKQNEPVALVQLGNPRKADAVFVRNVGRGLDRVILNPQHFVYVIDDQPELETRSNRQR
jgi:hypothetical protein